MENVKIRLSGPCQGTVEVNGQSVPCKSVKLDAEAGGLMTVTLVIFAGDLEVDLGGEYLVVKKVIE